MFGLKIGFAVCAMLFVASVNADSGNAGDCNALAKDITDYCKAHPLASTADADTKKTFYSGLFGGVVKPDVQSLAAKGKLSNQDDINKCILSVTDTCVKGCDQLSDIIRFSTALSKIISQATGSS